MIHLQSFLKIAAQLQEPTSGLDARAAAIVMRTVKNTVLTGRTVVCTIHQPSIDIFEVLAQVCILQRPKPRHQNCTAQQKDWSGHWQLFHVSAYRRKV